MFHHRSSAFGPRVAAIQKHLGAVEKELVTIGRIAGEKTSAAAVSASDQVSDAVVAALSEMVERFRQGRQAAADQAGRWGHQVLDTGAKYGGNAVERVTSEIDDRPLVALGVALGIGILIGAAILSASRR